MVAGLKSGNYAKKKEVEFKHHIVGILIKLWLKYRFILIIGYDYSGYCLLLSIFFLFLKYAKKTLQGYDDVMNVFHTLIC